MRKIIMFAVAIMVATGVWGQVLYSISGNGLKKKSYIVGTHHLVDASFAKTIPGMAKAMKEVKQVYGELKMTDMANADTMAMMQEAMLLPEGVTIRDVLSPEYYEKLNELFLNISGVPFDYPQVYETMGRMKPSALTSQLTILMYMSKHPLAFDPTKALDGYFQNEATASKKETYGLESSKFQIELLYSSNNMEKEVKSLECLLDNAEKYQKQLEELTEAYKQQNASALEEAIKGEKEIECDDMDLDKLIYERNKNWVGKMPGIMKEKPTLFVVGAGHLFGEEGVIEMLRREGYMVKAVTK